MDLVRRMDWNSASPMALRFAVSAVHAARSMRRMIGGTSTATRIAITAITATLSIKVQPAWLEAQTRVGDGREKARNAQENPPFAPGSRADEACISLVFTVHPAFLWIGVEKQRVAERSAGKMPGICLAW